MDKWRRIIKNKNAPTEVGHRLETYRIIFILICFNSKNNYFYEKSIL